MVKDFCICNNNNIISAKYLFTQIHNRVDRDRDRDIGEETNNYIRDQLRRWLKDDSRGYIMMMPHLIPTHPIPSQQHLISHLYCCYSSGLVSRGLFSASVLCYRLGCAEQGHLPTMALEDTTTWVLQRKIIIK